MFQGDKEERVHDQRNIDRSLVFTSACLNIRMHGWVGDNHSVFHQTVVIDGGEGGTVPISTSSDIAGRPKTR